ncbi:MAG: hypothetical protein EXS31_17355 [Pedosphaera sp.]|nr:hypothetical protein [Pedosphaera sp.]
MSLRHLPALVRTSVLWTLCWLFSLPICSCGQDFNRDGNVDILWRNKFTGENVVWFMNGSNFKASAALQRAEDLDWRIAGTGLFNDDDQVDIVWQNQRTGDRAVWLMKGTNMVSVAAISPRSQTGWSVVGVGDFDLDRHPDLLWQHETTGEKAIWLMNGTTMTKPEIVDRQSGPDWKVAVVGDLAGDKCADIILRQKQTGEYRLWIMKGLTISSNVAMPSIQRPDPDWHLVGTGDFDHDGQTDLLWRHVTVGLNLVTFLDGLAWKREEYIHPETDTDWRIGAQDTADSRYRIETNYGTLLTVTNGLSPAPFIRLSANMVLGEGQSIVAQRREPGATNWPAPIFTNTSAAVFTDTNVVVGERYEYQVVFTRNIAPRAVIMAGISARPVEDRGKIVLLVDKELAEDFPGIINPMLIDVAEDLIGDGWSVVRRMVPRHDHRTTGTAKQANRRNLAEIRALLRDEYASGATGVLIIGHVTVPYSGYYSADGHKDHTGAWPADMVYGDVDGNWSDGGQVVEHTMVPELANEPGDGKFENNFPPSNLEMFIGRVDFSRMSLLKTGDEPTDAEARLVQGYFAKARRYRLNRPPYPLGDGAITYGYFSQSGRSGIDMLVYENAQRNTSLFYQGGLSRLKVGDPFTQRTHSYTWGFVGGNGSVHAVNPGMQHLEHTVSTLAAPRGEGSVGFYLMVGSYFCDWNLPNNFMRATVATANYGLSAAWMAPFPTFTNWRFEEMAMGAPLGSGLLATVNDGPPYMMGDNHRFFAIMGDPTLRMHILSPPTNARAEKKDRMTELSWERGDPGAQYFIYRARSKAGPYTRISELPVTDTSYRDEAASKDEPAYMVRALKLVTSGCGSYTNLSQGVFVSRR